MSGWRCAALVVLVICASGVRGQDYGTRLGTVQRGGKVSYEPTGPGLLFDALDPAVRKWYVPQELYAEYQWKQWEYSNYARESYQRYVSTSLEGEYFYDFYGNFLKFKTSIVECDYCISVRIIIRKVIQFREEGESLFI